MRELEGDELAFGAGVAARGLRDNPSVVAVLGEGAVQRERYMTKLFGAYLPKMKHPPPGRVAPRLCRRRMRDGSAGNVPAAAAAAARDVRADQFSERMDRERALAYLETDKPENVVFYERFGFEVTDETVLLGAQNWFMRREPA